MPHFLTLSILTLIGCQASTHLRVTSRRNQVQDNICGAAMCTQSVWDTLACNDQLGGCHTCGSRIDYLINTFAYTPSDACTLVGFSQFLTECGGCIPDHVRAQGKNLRNATSSPSVNFPIQNAKCGMQHDPLTTILIRP